MQAASKKIALLRVQRVRARDLYHIAENNYIFIIYFLFFYIFITFLVFM